MKKVLGTSGLLQLRNTSVEDLDFVLRTEQLPENSEYVIAWTEQQHKDALTSKHKLHLILETPDKIRIGYAIISGLDNLNHSIELVRIVISDKGRGYGKEAIKEIQKCAFEKLNAHRLWLDVKEHNSRARHVYQNTGFVVEGTLRECLKVNNRYESLIIMSILKREYEKIKLQTASKS